MSVCLLKVQVFPPDGEHHEGRKGAGYTHCLHTHTCLSAWQEHQPQSCFRMNFLLTERTQRWEQTRCWFSEQTEPIKSLNVSRDLKARLSHRASVSVQTLLPRGARHGITSVHLLGFTSVANQSFLGRGGFFVCLFVCWKKEVKHQSS